MLSSLSGLRSHEVRGVEFTFFFAWREDADMYTNFLFDIYM